METRDAIVFLFSTDWFYSDVDKVAHMLSGVKFSEYDVLKFAARNSVGRMLKGVSSYYFVDFSEDRLASTLHSFLIDIEKKISPSGFSSLKNFFSVVGELSQKCSADLSLLRIAYALGCNLQDEIYLPLRLLCEDDSARKLARDETRSVRIGSNWDLSLGALFDGNDSEVFDFYSSIVVPSFFIRRVSKIISAYDDSDREFVFDLLYSIIGDSLESVISRERVAYVHKVAAIL